MKEESVRLLYTANSLKDQRKTTQANFIFTHMVESVDHKSTG